MPTLIHERIESARAGSNPTVIGRMASGWLVFGDTQFIPGYSLLLADPVVSSINDQPDDARGRFLLDMTLVGDALLEVTDAFRVNYSILGNTDPALHVHIFPRYDEEPEERRGGPVWLYDRAQRASVSFDAARDARVMREIYAQLERRRVIETPGPLLR